jgi:hypothetical protein
LLNLNDDNKEKKETGKKRFLFLKLLVEFL